MSFLRDLIWGSPEARRRKEEQRRKRERAYREGLQQGQIEREQREIEGSRMAGYEKGFTASPRKQQLRKVATSIGKGTVKAGKGIWKGIQNYEPPENDPFGIFPKKPRRKRSTRKRKKRRKR